MITSNNKTELEYSGPKVGSTYEVVVATDGNRVVVLEAPVEVHWYLAEFGNYPELFFLCSGSSGVWRCVYRFFSYGPEHYYDGDSGFDLVSKTRIEIN